MKEYTDGEKIIRATDKAYETIYKHRGFHPYIETLADPTEDIDPEIPFVEPPTIDDLTKDEIIDLLKEADIPHNPRDRKGDLYNLLKEG